MGSPMAGYLSKKHDVSIYNRTKSKCDNWIKNYKGKVIEKIIIYNTANLEIDVRKFIQVL